MQGLCERKLKESSNCTIVGFCAESENLLENAQAKIAKKGCDYLIANDISRKDIGFLQMIMKLQFWIKTVG